MAGRIRGNPESLDARSIARLKQAGPTPDQIFANLEDLNEEIEEEAEAQGVELVRPSTPDEEPLEVPVESDLDRMNRQLDEKLARQKELERQRQEEEAASEQAPEEQPQEVAIEDQVRNMLHSAKGAPSEAKIAAWKRHYGADAIQVLAMGKSDVYVFTYLRRASFQKIQQAMSKQAALGEQNDPEEFMMEQVIKQCVLWPELPVEFFYQSRSGVIPTLYSSIMLNSYHLTPQQAMVITAQL